MGATREGGIKAAATNKEKHGEDFYSQLGKLGGAAIPPEKRWFYRHPELAKKWGAIGGAKSSRKGIKNGEGKKRAHHE